MAVCDFCDQEMTVSAPCTWKPVLEVEGDAQERLSYPPDGDTTYPVECRDCGTPQGGLHHPGCHAERCPGCGGQAIGCDCHWEGGEPDEEDGKEDAPMTVDPLFNVYTDPELSIAFGADVKFSIDKHDNARFDSGSGGVGSMSMAYFIRSGVHYNIRAALMELDTMPRGLRLPLAKFAFPFPVSFKKD